MLTDITKDSPEYKLFVDRFGLDIKILEDAAQQGGHQFYKITVSDWYLFDTRESNPSQKYHLDR